MKKAIAIVGIHTGIGKTIVASILAEALGLDYWKPIQAGDLDDTDSIKVRTLVTNSESVIHPEAFRLTQPLSPHQAARLDGLTIDFRTMEWPVTKRGMLVETAGGVMSPINDQSTMVDFVAFYELPVILVVRHYLGSINHTLLSVEVLRKRKVPILGMVVSGEPNPSSLNFISANTAVPLLAHFPEIEVSRISVRKLAEINRSSLSTLLDHVNA